MRNIILFIIIFVISLDYSFAGNTDKSCLWGKYFTDYSTQCNNKVDFELYECRVTNLCDSCNKADSKKVFDTVPYDPADEHKDDTWIDVLKPLHDVQETYKTNMNSIYKCVLIDIQVRWLEYLEKIISSTDKTWSIKKELSQKISSEKSKLKSKKSQLQCGWLSDDKSTSTLIKKEVLDQVTFEFCKYNFYLLYLKEGYYSDTKNILWLKEEDLNNTTTSEPIEITNITIQANNINNEIDNEVIKIQKVFPLAYYAYSEYEDSYLLHLLLTLIKQDYVIAREQLSKVLWPINQVAYKIKDAMKNY
jgi:hypothetical protein